MFCFNVYIQYIIFDGRVILIGMKHMFIDTECIGCYAQLFKSMAVECNLNLNYWSLRKADAEQMSAGVTARL